MDAAAAGCSVLDLFDATSGAAALRAPHGQPISFRQLVDFARGLDLSSLAGLDGDDRVAVALRDGVVAALAFLALPLACTFAPLSRSLRASEYAFEFDDLPAAAVLVHDDDGAEVFVAAAREASLPVVVAVVDTHGFFSVEPRGAAAAPRPAAAPPSLSCSTPIATALELAPGATVLNVMPLFHIHGLAANVLAALAAGACCVAAPGFAALGPAGVLDALRGVDGYSAVPTMHASLLDALAGDRTSSRRRALGPTGKALRVGLAARLGLPTLESERATFDAGDVDWAPSRAAARRVDEIVGDAADGVDSMGVFARRAAAAAPPETNAVAAAPPETGTVVSVAGVAPRPADRSEEASRRSGGRWRVRALRRMRRRAPSSAFSPWRNDMAAFDAGVFSEFAPTTAPAKCVVGGRKRDVAVAGAIRGGSATPRPCTVDSQEHGAAGLFPDRDGARRRPGFLGMLS
ncbi:ligase [Aureococcus anophagefferens]|nr:ligase [Aureococcus anophagefferens]